MTSLRYLFCQIKTEPSSAGEQLDRDIFGARQKCQSKETIFVSFDIFRESYEKEEFEDYAQKSIEMKKDFFVEAKVIEKFTDIDISLSIMNS